MGKQMEGNNPDDGHLKFMACNDGSDASYSAIYTLVNGYMKRELDHLYMAHVWSKAKEEAAHN